MRRLVTFVLLTALAVAATVWLADRPGEVTIRWQGWRVDTTVPVLLLALGLVLLALHLLGRLWRAIGGAPRRWLADWRLGRERKGYAALSAGMAAVAAGDAARAGKLARRADRLLKGQAAAGLLGVQAARLAGSEAGLAERYRAMIEHKDTAFLGHQGLAELALKAGDRQEARAEAAHAFRLRPGAEGLAEMLSGLCMAEGDWAEAGQVLRMAARHGGMAGPALARRQAQVLMGRALSAEQAGDAGQALDWALDGRDADPSFAPAVVLAARLLAARGKLRRAAGLLKSAYKAAPHPLLVRGWLDLGGAEPPLARVKRLQELVKANEAAPDGHQALAEVALDAQLWGLARAHLERVLAGSPAPSVFQLLARVEREERKDEAAAQNWLARAHAEARPQPGWRCGACGGRHDGFALVCSHCGAAGKVEWT